MRILIGSLGDLGYLVKPLPAADGQPSWRRFEDEMSLIAHLKELSINDIEVRGIFRVLRAQGRAILTLPEPERRPHPAVHRRPAAARSAASR
jgi:hypothetical protein